MSKTKRKFSRENINLQKPLPWVTEALKHNGLKEIRGYHHNKTIQRWLRQLGAWWQDDETPWCGVFVAHCLTHARRGIPKHWYRAKAYAKYGTSLNKPAYGCLGVMSRKGGGHVCIIIGKTRDGRLVVIGGNQGNKVSIAAYPCSRFSHFIFPSRANGVPSMPYQFRFDLPTYANGDYQQPLSEA